jgi:hypothetical protein
MIEGLQSLFAKNEENMSVAIFFHNIFRLRLVLTPVSTSGKNSGVPFDGTPP